MTRVVALLLAVVWALTGCTVGEPSAEEWNESARTALDDASAAAATARLVLEEVRADGVWSAYAVTVTADAEESASTAEETVTTLQPPPGRRDRADRLLTALGDAADAVRAARMAAVDGVAPDFALLDRLDRAIADLDRAARQL